MADSEFSRRTLLLGAAAGAVVANTSFRRAGAAPPGRRVAVLGGGIAGLTAAHELIERGFEVTVYERRMLGGKARSMDTDLPVTDGRRPLPGEHGFRFFPGFYRHVPETMRRIPFPGNRNGVWDNFVPVLTATAAIDGPNLTAPFELSLEAIGKSVATPELLLDTLLGGLTYVPRVPYLDLLGFAQRLLTYFTSCDERRLGQWERMAFIDFARARGANPNYLFVISTVTRTLVAAKENLASANTICKVAESFLLTLIDRGSDGAPDRVLNAPTNEAWIDPWVEYLKQRGVRFEVGSEVQGLEVEGGQIGSAVVRSAGGAASRVEADYFVAALAAEQVVRLWSPEVLALDPDLERISQLFVDWMTGIQFYLRTDNPISAGHIGFIESPWRLTGINQAQFWKGRDIARDYGDGQVRDILSVDISDWDAPGMLYGKPAKQCSPDEIARETWAQIMKTQSGRLLLPDTLHDSDLHSWFLDPGIHWDPAAGVNSNDDPLLVNTAGSWDNRPTGATGIPNLFLAGDYLRTNVDLATMEGANEGGRMAANAVLDAAGSPAPRAALFPHVSIAEFDGARALDRDRWFAGRPNLFDLP
ncbi:FAD-dependent oxidoreductase [Nocardia sp. NBC_01388]|uniref:hydroxysqualene dehydroxylase n=1 Tax=Nocardia sp. NBC_01388 TaxID=2903596 RepID=UPI00324BD3F6